MYGIAPSPPSTSVLKDIYHVVSLANNAKDQIMALECEIFALHSGKPFSHPATNQAATSLGSQPPSSRASSECPANAPSALFTITNHPTLSLAPTSSSASSTELPSSLASMS
jgi:hypothetical protein